MVFDSIVELYAGEKRYRLHVHPSTTDSRSFFEESHLDVSVRIWREPTSAIEYDMIWLL